MLAGIYIFSFIQNVLSSLQPTYRAPTVPDNAYFADAFESEESYSSR